MKELMPNKNTFGVRTNIQVIKNENALDDLLTRIHEMMLLKTHSHEDDMITDHEVKGVS